MQKYCIVHFIEPLPIGYEFIAKDNWPLHITLASNFTLPVLDQSFVDQLNNFCATTPPLSVRVAEDTYFGKDHDVHVSLIDMSNGLKVLHNTLISLLEEAGAVFDEPKYNRDGYRAHATIQLSARLKQGDNVVIDSLSLIDMFPSQDIAKRKVITTLELTNTTS